MSILSYLEQLGDSRIPFIYGDKRPTAEELIETTLRFRSENSLFENRLVSIQAHDWFDYLLQLIALDGWAAAILLGSPAELRKDSSNDIPKVLDGNVSDEISQLLGEGAEPQRTETHWLMMTSGTTGAPKVIQHDVGTLTRTLSASSSSNFRWILTYAPSRFAGLQVVLHALISQQELVVPTSSKTDSLVATMADQGVTAASATPSMWRQILMSPRIGQVKLHQVTLGGEIADNRILSLLSKQFPTARITHIYASTEAGVGFSVSDGEEGFPASWLEKEHRGVTMRISANGHLMVRHAKHAQGQEIESRLDSEGFLDTLDRVSLANDRVLFQGRATGAINVGGTKVHPEAVERVLRLAPGVLDARVFPKKSSILGELVAAQVVAVGVEQDDSAFCKRVLEFCREHLARHQIPTTVELVDQIPLSKSGKIDRR